MGAEFGPAYELRMALIALFRQDGQLRFLLFPADRPRIDANDYRVYESAVELPENLRGTLPRILIETISNSANDEQDGSYDRASVTTYIHHFVERDESQRIELLSKRTTQLMGVLGSTPPAPTRIIASESIKTGPRVGPVKEPGFNDAYRLTETYVSSSVGVLA